MLANVMRTQVVMNALTRSVTLTRLICLLPLGLMAGCGLGEGDHGCPEDQLCVDVAAVAGSAIDLAIARTDERTDSIYLHAALPYGSAGRCYNVPDDLVARANGRPPVAVGVSYEHGDAIVFTSDCPPAQNLGAVFTVPTGTDPITITFSRGDDRASMTVTRAARPPVDFAFSTTTVARGATFSADLTTTGPALSTAEGCWVGYLSWDSGERGMTMKLSPEATASGIHLGIAFAEDLPADQLPPGGTHLTVGTNCDTDASVSCSHVRSCAVHEPDRSFGPFAIQLL
jgi:hypothetical protein